LQDNLDAEAATRLANDVTLQGNINAEWERALGVEDVLATNLAAEVTRATGIEAGHDTRLTSLEGFIMEDAQELTEAFTGAGVSYTLSNAVQDTNKFLVKGYVNGIFVAIATVEGAVVTLAGEAYAIDGADTVTFTYQF